MGRKSADALVKPTSHGSSSAASSPNVRFLRTETSSKAGSVAPSEPRGTDAQRWSRSRCQSTVQVNGASCAGKVHVLIRGGLESGSGSRLYAESRSRGVRAPRWFQQSAEAIVRIRHTPLATRKGRTMKNKGELPVNSDRGALSRKLEFACEGDWMRLAKLLRPESTDPAFDDQPTLGMSPKGDSGAEPASLRGTA